ncbi:hypothetical protein [Pseudomonas pseudonitroreducens]|jgi:integrase|uniref:hypothetical protein n=1 Tax=Pseudomonas pseudonitroreducens TaxID=2892326 RepID=UPI001F412A0E|nr:hypothetical protein [Pseudomonas pseudonitroreducens]
MKGAKRGGNIPLNETHLELGGLICTDRKPVRVVSRDGDGVVLSVFDDDDWYLPRYEGDPEQTVMRFKYWYPGFTCDKSLDELVRQTKEIVWHMLEVKRNSLSPRTVDHYFHMLVDMCRFSALYGLSIFEILSEDEKCRLFIHHVSDSWQLSYLRSLLSALQEPEALSLPFRPVGRTLIQEASSLLKKFPEYKQTPVIPTRIFSQVISYLMGEINICEGVVDSLVEVVKELRGKKPSSAEEWKRLRWMSKADFSVILDRLGLSDFYGSRGYSIARNTFYILTEMLFVCKYVIHIFSGMRDSEVNYLPYDCLRSYVDGGLRHYMIHGFTTKRSGGKHRESRWVTSIEGVKAIRLAQKISEGIYSCIGVDANRTSGCRLFVSPGVVRFWPKRGDEAKVVDFDISRFTRIVERMSLTIEQVDCDELMRIDPFRDWGESGIVVGGCWKLRTHQFRRSLALYASRSGLVSITSLRRQLQHITEEMTRYYSDGSFFARNMLEYDKDHFSVDYIETLPEGEALSFFENVLSSKEKLFGGAGSWIEAHSSSRNNVTFESRSETIEKFIKGLLSYKETPVGGCMKSGDCQQRSFGRWVYCLAHCSDSVVSLKKLAKLIEVQRRFVSDLADGTVYRRTERFVLDEYERLYNQFLEKA